jgi:hypothetical protein
MLKLNNNTGGLEIKNLTSNKQIQQFSITVPDAGRYAINYFNKLGQNVYSKQLTLLKGTQNCTIAKNITNVEALVATISNGSYKTSTKFVTNN